MRPRELMKPETNTFYKNQDSRLHQDHLIRPRELTTPETNTFGKNITSRTPDKTKGNDDTRNTHIQQSQANGLRQEHLRPKELMKSEINTFYKTGTIEYIKNNC